MFAVFSYIHVLGISGWRTWFTRLMDCFTVGANLANRSICGDIKYAYDVASKARNVQFVSIRIQNCPTGLIDVTTVAGSEVCDLFHDTPIVIENRQAVVTLFGDQIKVGNKQI